MAVILVFSFLAIFEVGQISDHRIAILEQNQNAVVLQLAERQQTRMIKTQELKKTLNDARQIKAIDVVNENIQTCWMKQASPAFVSARKFFLGHPEIFKSKNIKQEDLERQTFVPHLVESIDRQCIQQVLDPVVMSSAPVEMVDLIYPNR